MRRAALLLTIFAALGAFAQASSSSPVVVELFTSEGCSSCPPADALLRELNQHSIVGTPPVLVLGEHVDYWNHGGWVDRFSSAEFTQRQTQYVRRFNLNSPYTPQMVIDGQAEMVGNDRSDALRAINKSAESSKPEQITLSWEGPDRVHILAHSATPMTAQIVLAVTEDGLSTAVKDGENSGHTLRHAGVVRVLRPVGTASNGAFTTVVKVPSDPNWKADSLKVVVFAQEPKQGRILGAASLDWLH